MQPNLQSVRAGQAVKASDLNRIIAAVKANYISSATGLIVERTANGVVLRVPRTDSRQVESPSEFLFVNKLAASVNAETSEAEVWIYAPDGVPSIFYPGPSGGSFPVSAGAVEWRMPAYVDSSLARDGDWVNTGLGSASKCYAYIASGVVKFASDVPSSGEASDTVTDVTPYVWIGKKNATTNKWCNIVVGAVGVSAYVVHDELLLDDE